MKQEDKDTDSYRFHVMSQFGIQFNNPLISTTNIILPFDDKPYTWAEKQRDKIIWRRKVIKAWANRLIVVVLGLVLSATELYLSLLLADFIGSHSVASLIGILDAMFVILTFLHLSTFFETNPNYIELRKKK